MPRFSLPEDLTALDELLLKGDAWPTSRPIMSTALVLARPPAPGRLEASFERAARSVPRMRQRVARSPWTAGRATWVDDDAFDPSFHLRRIGAPGDGTLAAALAWASGGATAPFDPARPLWDAVMVERLVDGRALVWIRAHHAIADGVRAMQMMAGLLDLEPSPPVPPADAEAPDAGSALSPAAAQLVRSVSRAWVTNPRRAVSRSRSLWGASLHPLHAVTSSTSYVRSALRTMDRGDAEPSPLLSERSGSRRFVTVEVPLKAIKVAARTHGVTLNDVYLTALVGGLRKYHEASGSPVGDVALALPIDLADQDEHAAGNHISAAVIAGPATIEDPVERLKAVHELVASRRAEPGLRALDDLAPTLRQLPARIAIAAVGAHARRVDLQASNLIGPPCPLYLAGEQVERLYGFGPLPGIPVMAVLVSYDGVCTVGFTLDPAAVTDTELFLQSVREAFAELLVRDIAPTMVPEDQP
jgi:diacylglycerol O-acyltransferase / wax synthase